MFPAYHRADGPVSGALFTDMKRLSQQDSPGLDTENVLGWKHSACSHIWFWSKLYSQNRIFKTPSQTFPITLMLTGHLYKVYQTARVVCALLFFRVRSFDWRTWRKYDRLEKCRTWTLPCCSRWLHLKTSHDNNQFLIFFFFTDRETDRAGLPEDPGGKIKKRKKE